MLGTLVVLYLFLGGFGAGILCVTAVWSLVFHRTMSRSQAQTDAFDGFKARCYGLGFVVLCLAALCLLLDLGRPERFFLLFVRPTFSILSFGSFALLASLLVGGFLVAANVLYVPFVHAPARKVAEVLCVIVSLAMMAYTGVYVACVEAVALWNNVAIPVLFACSSLSSALSALFVAMPFVRDMRLLQGWTMALHRVHLGVLVLEVVSLGAFLAIAYADPFAHGSLQLLLSGEGFGGWLIVGVTVMGLLVPLASEGFMMAARRLLRLLPVDVLCIAGGLLLRFCVVWSGMH
ncbi:NrfD/PsrC family molybdoenzyme membrane anchor subunit [Eggerthella guodeyinii]|uniref:Polysulfide reductase n=1 Tax=Eggerthella guodeyinii TaxID=2690837 RepID=A0A6N7RNA4_9ACTN|nr:NrfD/PsrC family molybdoenzyme membrane anchor subunit [Eggerthella guodeyinii]MRX82634.1 polysulfide reductase [Eggerthella guodeyinii]